jgi:SAM-dependent methyltransferase
MSFVKNKIYGNLNLLGIDVSKMKMFVKGLSSYLKDKKELTQQKGHDTQFPFGSKRPVFEDRFAESGSASGHYFHQDLLVAQKIYENKPVRHVDIGSRTDGFIAHVAVFREIEVFDIREQTSKIKNIVFKQADLMTLTDSLIDYCDSISALHSIEHFGLGRYGDPIDYNGHLKAIKNITKILKTGGKFYFSVPIGPQRINFNAHRVFSIKYLLELFTRDFTLISFSYVDDKGDLKEDIKLNEELIQTNCGCFYGCGIFELTKR